MRLRYLVVGMLLGALFATGVGVSMAKKNGPKKKGVIATVATGKNEISATTGKRNAGDANGRAGFTSVIDGTEFCWGYAAKNVDGTPSGAHIHRGRRNETGPIVIPLDTPASADPGAASGCDTITAQLAREIKKHPRRFYFNLHSTPDYPAGAVRGQLKRR